MKNNCFEKLMEDAFRKFGEGFGFDCIYDQQHATLRWNIQMLISSQRQPSTSENTLTTSSRGKL